MKEIIVPILSYLRQYFSDFGQIIVGPKSFVLKRIDSGNFDNSKSFLFLGLSVVISALMQAPLPHHEGIFTLFVETFLVYFLWILGFSVAIHVAWWVVGGRAPYKDYFAVTTYMISTFSLMWMSILLILFGIFRTFYEDSFNTPYYVHVPNEYERLVVTYQASEILNLLPLFLVYNFWIIWGAYRHVNHSSIEKSFQAFILTAILVLPVLFFYSAVEMASHMP